jgi:hypothetical protein
MDAKYIITDSNVPIVFPASQEHRSIAERVVGADHLFKRIVSAGKLVIAIENSGGHPIPIVEVLHGSTSLDISPDKDQEKIDKRLLAQMLRIGSFWNL